MGKSVNPFTGIGLKIIFSQPTSKSFLITLLDELLAGGYWIEDLVFLDKEDHAEHVRNKRIIYDLYRRASTGEYIIVKMQNHKHLDFVDRTLHHMCHAMSRQTEAPLAMEVHSPDDGEEGPEVRKLLMPYGTIYKLHTVYGVFFMNFKESGLPDRFRVDSGILDLESHETLNPHFRQIYLQFPYFTKELNERGTLLERPLYALKDMGHWIRMPDTLKEQVPTHLSRLAAVANLSSENRLAYGRAVDRYNTDRLMEETFLQEVEEAKEKAIAEAKTNGMKEGLEKGLREGLEKDHLSEKYVTAKDLKELGVSKSLIAQSTGSPEEEIEGLQFLK